MEIHRSPELKYSAGFKYQAVEDYWVQTAIDPPQRAAALFVSLETSGLLTIERGFAWDGPSGLTIDTDSSMVAALVHDALYRLIQHGALDVKYQVDADNLLYDLGREDGMWQWRARAWWRLVSRFGVKHAREKKAVLVIKSGGNPIEQKIENATEQVKAATGMGELKSSKEV